MNTGSFSNCLRQIYNYFRQKGISQPKKVVFDQEKISKVEEVKKVKLSILNHENSNLIGNLLGIFTFLKNHLFLEMSNFLVVC